MAHDTIKNIQEEVYYDLDGTLSSLNSTLDFMKGYYSYRKLIFRPLLYKIVVNSLLVLRLYHPYRSRKMMLDILLKGIKVEQLQEYFDKVYKKDFMASLTPLGMEVIKKDNSKSIMLTGCTEIPALWIADIFGIKKVIATELNYKRGRIHGMKNDTYGNYKARYVTKDHTVKKIYYTDDLKAEKSLIPFMDQIIEV